MVTPNLSVGPLGLGMRLLSGSQLAWEQTSPPPHMTLRVTLQSCDHFAGSSAPTSQPLVALLERDSVETGTGLTRRGPLCEDNIIVLVH